MNTFLSGKLSKACLFLVVIAPLLTLSITVNAQTVQVGAGSYSTVLPSGEIGPQNSSNQNVSPKISAGFSLPVQSNDYWSSLIYPFFSDPHSNVLYAHPILAKARGNGLQIGYTDSHVFAADDYLYPFSHQLTVSVDGLNASKTLTDHYGDWTVTALWEQSEKTMRATLGHGLPFVFFELSGGDAVVSTASSPNIWYQEGAVLGITVNGKHYGLFAPTGSTWSGSSTLKSSLNNQDFLSVALLPEASTETLLFFKNHAYAFVTNSTIEWNYDEASSIVTSVYSYQTELKDSAESHSNQTLSALYRHQWLHTPNVLTSYTYESPNGEMKLFEGSTFTTEIKFPGILPALPNNGDYNPSDMLALVQQAATENIGPGPTYDNGKAMGRFATLVHIADQIGAIDERDHFLAEIKNRLQDWFTVGGQQEYMYNDEWDVLTGYPSGFGADNQINDHHFHSSYAIRSAATIAQFDPEWAAQEQWGGMVNLLIKDSNNWDRTDTQFPFLRSHDAYAGHSWAAGHGDFGDGNNQESSSESMNFATAVILWGEVTGQDEIRDLGVFLHATEMTAVEQYWFDVDNEVFPADYPHVAIGMVWGGKGVHSTWFGADPEFIHGINFLPITSGSLYLGRHPDYVTANYNEIVEERNGQPIIWKDILWQFLALSDPNRALSYYFEDPNYERFDGESRANTLHWLYNMKKMGHVDTTTFADIATYAVFKKSNGEKTYIAYNADSEPRTVTFSNGFTLTIPSNRLLSASTADTNPDAPVSLLIADKTKGKTPLTVHFEGSKSFDRNGSPLTYLWEFGTLASSSAADTSFTFSEVGEYMISLTVTNENNLSATDSTRIEVLGNGTPFGGTPVRVPGKIEAENYDEGGQGIAYNDVDANNIGLAYRPDEGVDLEGANDGTFDVFWIVAGEWLEYTFEVEEDGEYDFTPYVSTVPGFGYLRMSIDNEDVSGRKNVTGTGGWQNWRPIPITNIPLQAGVHRLRFDFDSDSDKQGWLFSLNNIVVSKSTSVNSEEMSEPQTFTLSQNYPNPFNPSTNIEFMLPESGNVRLAVYNMLGQSVQILTDGFMAEGRHTVTFNAQSLSSGFYFYQIEFNGQLLTRKMLLLK